MNCPACGKQIDPPGVNLPGATVCPHCKKRVENPAWPPSDPNRFPPGMAPPPAPMGAGSPAETPAAPVQSKSELLKSLLPKPQAPTREDSSESLDFEELFPSASAPPSTKNTSGLTISGPPISTTEDRSPSSEIPLVHEPKRTLVTEDGEELDFSLPTAEERAAFKKKFDLMILLLAAGVLIVAFVLLLKFVE